MQLCVVPMKPLAKAKGRLAEVLTAAERRDLSLAMLWDVASVAATMDRAWVICSDEEAADVATSCGANAVVDQTPEAGLNSSLEAATRDAVAAGFDGMLIISADCPAVTPEDLRAIALGGRGVAISPDRWTTGTNALWRQPCDIIEANFGRMSRRSHQGLAYASRIPLARVPRDRVALDVDRPRDLDEICKLGAGPRTTEALRRLGYPRGPGGQ